MESLWIEIDCENNKNILCGIYNRHPSTNLELFLENFDMTINKVHRENKYCTIMGEFNINLLNFDTDPSTNDFLNIINTCFFCPQILQPARITHHSATLIDNIFFNSLEHHVISGNILTDITDHLPNFLVINKLSAIPVNLTLYKRDYSSFDDSSYIGEFSSVDWVDVLPDNINVDAIFETFLTKTNEIIDKYVPLKKLTRKELKDMSKPWITPEIKINKN